MKEIKAPAFVNNKLRTIFLAGSIEQGTAEDWQKEVVTKLKNCSVTWFTLLNPRRAKWNTKLPQKLDNPIFNEQVNWELQAIEHSEWVLMYFDPKTQSPITLLELGLIAATKPKNLIVVCPEGYYRKGNVDIVCDRYHVRQYDTLEQAIQFFKSSGFLDKRL